MGRNARLFSDLSCLLTRPFSLSFFQTAGNFPQFLVVRLVPSDHRGIAVCRTAFVSSPIVESRFLVDLSHCSAETVEKVLREVPDIVTKCPRGSILIFTDFSAAIFNPEALRVMKESAVFDKPYVKKSAWIGAENFPEGFSEDQRVFQPRFQFIQDPRGRFGVVDTWNELFIHATLRRCISCRSTFRP
jgi:hypothetical protein